jgi:hypothetical protein
MERAGAAGAIAPSAAVGPDEADPPTGRPCPRSAFSLPASTAR